MIDPTWLPDELAEINTFVAEQRENKPLYIIYTHSDFDHIIGAGVYKDAIVIASEAFANRANKEIILEEIKAFDEQYYIHRSYPIIYPEVEFTIEHHGQRLQVGKTTLTFYLAPGHTEDDLFTIIEPGGIFLAGDYFSDIEIPLIDGNYKDYVTTVNLAKELLQQHDIEVLIPGHGKVTTDQKEIEERITFTEYYLTELLNNEQKLAKECRLKFPFYGKLMQKQHENNVFKAQNGL